MRRKGYGSRFVCVCVCLSVTTLATTQFISKVKTRYYKVGGRLFLDFDSQISPKRLCFRDKELFICHDNPDRFFSTKNTPSDS